MSSGRAENLLRGRMAALRRVRADRLLRRARTERFWWPAVFVGVTLVTWTGMLWQPLEGLDHSWEAGIALATAHGLSYGRGVVWTFGPMGFLDFPTLWVGSLATLAFLYLSLLRVGTAAALYLGARRSFGRVASVILAVLAASIAGGVAESALLFVVAVWALRVRLTGRPAVLLAVGVGAMTAQQLQDKVSGGIAFMLMSALLLVSLPAPRRKVILAGASASIATFLALWLAASQTIGAIPSYVEGAIQVSSGYAAAMGSGSSPGTDWTVYAALLILGVGGWAAWNSTEGGPVRQRLGAISIWTVFWFFAFKEGYVRADPGHIASFFTAVIIAWFGFYWPRESRAAAVMTIGSLMILTLAISTVPLTTAVDPSRDVSSAVKDVKILLSPERRAAMVHQARATIDSSEGIDPGALRLLQGHTVAVFPSELALVWADRLNWRPIPVLQSYAAYTPYLDRLDASFLSSENAPQRILVNGDLTIDDRYLGFDEPRTTRTLLCRYRALNPKTHGYFVLARGANQCSAPHLISTEVGSWGEVVPVPPPPTPHSLVSVSISGVGVHGLESLTSFLLRPALRYIVYRSFRFRLVEGTAGDGLPLRVSGDLDYPPRISLVPQWNAIAVARDNEPTGGRPITFRFYAQTYSS